MKKSIYMLCPSIGSGINLIENEGIRWFPNFSMRNIAFFSNGFSFIHVDAR